MKTAISMLLLLSCFSQFCHAASEEERKNKWDKLREIKRGTTLILHPQLGEVTRSPNMVEPGSKLAENFSAIHLVMVVDPDNQQKFKLDMNASYLRDQWMNYYLAARKEGDRMALKKLSREEDCHSGPGCLRQERLEVSLSIMDMFNNIDGHGLDIVLRGEEDTDVHISSLYLLAMMQSMTAFDP